MTGYMTYKQLRNAYAALARVHGQVRWELDMAMAQLAGRLKREALSAKLQIMIALVIAAAGSMLRRWNG